MVARALRRFQEDESGPVAVEYAILLGLLIVACMSVIDALGGSQVAFWDGILDTYNNATDEAFVTGTSGTDG